MVGYLMAALVYGTLFPIVGWRGMFVIGALPAFSGHLHPHEGGRISRMAARPGLARNQRQGELARTSSISLDVFHF